MVPKNYESNVFINCPFDDGYADIMDAMIFAVIDCGFTPQTAKDLTANGKERLQNIFELIENSQYLISDISKIEIDAQGGLPRFNMPIELGICIGARQFGNKHNKNKKLLLLENIQYESKKYASDLSGVDCKHHNNDYKKVIHCIRDWLNHFKSTILPGGEYIEYKYNEFLIKLPKILESLKLSQKTLTYKDKIFIMNNYLRTLDDSE